MVPLPEISKPDQLLETETVVVPPDKLPLLVSFGRTMLKESPVIEPLFVDGAVAVIVNAPVAIILPSLVKLEVDTLPVPTLMTPVAAFWNVPPTIVSAPAAE